MPEKQDHICLLWKQIRREITIENKVIKKGKHQVTLVDNGEGGRVSELSDGQGHTRCSYDVHTASIVPGTEGH